VRFGWLEINSADDNENPIRKSRIKKIKYNENSKTISKEVYLKLRFSYRSMDVLK
jgi:hypothetical protein